MEAKRDDNYVTVLLATSAADDSTPIRVFVDATTRRLYVNAVLGGSSTTADGRQTVTTAGTAVQLSTSDTTTTKIYIQAEADNTDVIVVGSSTVVAALATRRGIALFPTQSILITSDNLDEVYIDSIVSGEGVIFLYEA